MPILLAALLACLTLSTTAVAQEAPDADMDQRVGILFHIGMTALAEAEQADSDDEKEKLHDRAIAAFRMILVNRPDLIRVRLELARTFFLKGRDGLARRHFELVLAGGVPFVDEIGVRLEMDRQLLPLLWARGTAAYRERDHQTRDFLDGPMADFTFSLAWTAAPVLRVHATWGSQQLPMRCV